MTSPKHRGCSPGSADKKTGTSGKDGSSGDGDKTPSCSLKGKSPQCTPSPNRSPARNSGTRDARRPREIIVEWNIREMGSSGNWPQLAKTNYNEYDDAEFHDDRNALDAICSTIPPEMVPTLATKVTARQAWEAIKTLCIGVDCVQKAMA